MKKLFKDMMRPLYKIMQGKNERELFRLYSKWGGRKRYERVNKVNFLEYSFNVPDLTSFLWQFEELFVNEIYKFYSKNTIPVIYDCGANIGMSCLYFKKIYPNAKIKAFEADKNIVLDLKNNLSANNIYDVNIINSAIWVNDNGIVFSLDGADAGSINGSGNTINVDSTSLKELLKEEEYIDLLKIDIEGAEYEVLLDCQNSLGNVENLFVEYHSWNNSNQKLSEILAVFEKNKFRYYIESLSYREMPFINKGLFRDMDLQLNIFGTKA